MKIKFLKLLTLFILTLNISAAFAYKDDWQLYIKNGMKDGRLVLHYQECQMQEFCLPTVYSIELQPEESIRLRQKTLDKVMHEISLVSANYIDQNNIEHVCTYEVSIKILGWNYQEFFYNPLFNIFYIKKSPVIIDITLM
jgi:hypothetical protein